MSNVNGRNWFQSSRVFFHHRHCLLVTRSGIGFGASYGRSNQSLMPVADDEEMTLDLLTKTTGASATVAHFNKIAELTGVGRPSTDAGRLNQETRWVCRLAEVNVRYWHKADISQRLRFGRYRVVSGHCRSRKT